MKTEVNRKPMQLAIACMLVICAIVGISHMGADSDADPVEPYSVSGTTLTITANIANASDITIGDWSAITALVIENSVTSIADGSLSNGTGIVTIAAPFSLKDKLSDIFGSTDYSTATRTFEDEDGWKHVIVGEGTTKIGEEYKATNIKTKLKSIVIASTVTEFNTAVVGNKGSFSGCTELESVTFLGNNITTIPFYTFYNCKIAQIDIPSSVTAIQGSAFQGCPLVTVVLPDGITGLGGAFTDCKLLKNLYVASSPVKEGVILPDGIALQGNMFRGCESIETVVVGSGSVDLNNAGSVFSGCKSLKSVTLPDTITRMGGEFFKDCESLETVKLPASLIHIRERAFENCSSLKTIDFNGVKDFTYPVTGYVFGGCTSLENEIISKGELYFAPRVASGTYVVTDGVITINSDAYGVCDNMTSLTFADSVEKIGATAFKNCPNLAEVKNLPKFVEIGKNAFKGTGLTESIVVNDTLIFAPDTYEQYTIPESIRSIGNSAFEGNAKLKKVVFEGDMSYLTLGTDIFKNCTSLETVVLPKGLGFMYNGMFNGCSSLKDIQLTEDITYIYANAFKGTGIEELIIPESVTCIESSAFANCTELKKVVFTSNDIQFKTGTAVSAQIFAGCSNLTSVTLPSPMTSIPKQMFQNCTSLTSIEWPAGLQYIETGAFQASGLTEVILPEGLYYIEDNAFQNCTKIEKLVLPSTIAYTTAGNGPPMGANCFRSIGTGTENGADVTIRGSPNYPINLNENKKNQFYGAKIHDLIIEESPVFGKSTFTKAEIHGKIIVSGGSSFNLSSDLAGIKDYIDKDGYLTVYVKNGDTYVEGKMMSVGQMGANVDYNKTGEILNIPKDVIAIPVVNLFQRLNFNGFTVDPENPYFTVEGRGLYFELDNKDSNKLEDAKLVYMIMKDLNDGNGLPMDIVIPEGVTRMGSKSTLNQDFIRTSITLPTSIKVLEPMSVWNTWATIIASTETMPVFEIGTGQLGIYVSEDMPQSVIDAFDPMPAYDGRVAEIVGIYKTFGDSVLAFKMPLGSAELGITDGGDHVAFTITLMPAYDRSDITVYKGDRNNSTVVVPENDGSLKVQKVSGVTLLNLSGLEINRYSLSAEDPEGFFLAFSEIVYDTVKDGTPVVFTITPAPGYKVQPSGLTVSINGDEIPAEFRNGRYFCTFTIAGDSTISVSGIVPKGTYNVSFDSNGGDAIDGQQVIEGSVATIPKKPTKEGSLFSGWYLRNALYDFATPVSSNITLRAMWISDNTATHSLSLSADNGYFLATSKNTNEVLSEDSKIPSGTTVTLAFFPSWGYEVRSWTVNGVQQKTISTEMTVVISSDTVVEVSTEFTRSSFPYLETDIKAPTKNDASKMIWKIRGTDGFNGMVYTPSIMGDYVYSISGKDLYKISLATGELVKKVATGGASSYYNLTTVGNGYILVGFTGQAYDADLNPVFNLRYGTAQNDLGRPHETKTYYEDGYYYIFTDSKVYKYLADDMDPNSNNAQYPVATGDTLYTHYISWYQGQSNLVFTDDFIIGIEYSGDKDQHRHLVTYDINTLKVIDSYTFEGALGGNLNTGYISYYNGTAYFNTYSPNSNMFSTSNEKWDTMSSVELDSNGMFNPATVHYYNLNTTSYPSSLIVVGDYGYINAGNSFRVFDMKTMTVTKSISSTMSHGNMAVSVQGDKVYAYVIPYGSSTTLRIFEHDQTANTLADVSINNAVDTAEYSSQIVHFGPHGEILYYNDSGYLFCIAPQYTASFVTNGADPVDDIPFYPSDAIDLPTLDRPDFQFAGWYDNPSFDGKAIRSIEPGTYGDRTYYAKFLITDENAMIKSVSIDQFVDGGKSVMLSVDAGINAPEKVLIVTYSAYIDLPEGKILNPFMTEIVELAKDKNSAVFTPTGATKVESITVTCCYEIESVLYSTTYAKAMVPAVYSIVDLSIDPSLTLSFNGAEVTGGMQMRFGYYTVKVDGGSGQYLVNGTVADGTDILYYYGQSLTVTEATS